jgi:hypothetical protein
VFSFGIIVIDVLYVKWEFIEPIVPKIIDTIRNNIERGKAIVVDKNYKR